MPKTYLWKFLHEIDGKIKSERGCCEWDTKWKKYDGVVKCCEGGFHASERIIDALSYVKGSILAKVEVRGESHVEKDKQSWQEMRIVKAYKWAKTDNIKLAIFAARSVLDIYEERYPKDDRPRKAIEAAETYLKNPTSSTTAAYASACAAHDASHAHAYADAADAAYAATYAAYAAYASADAVYAVVCAATADAAALDKIDKWLLSNVNNLEICTLPKKSKN